MHPYTNQPQSDNGRNESGHRGPLSRTWPHLFKKRRRYSPVRESAQQQQQQQQQAHPQAPAETFLPVQSTEPIRPVKPLIVRPRSIRTPSLVADSASTISSISQTSTQPPKRIPISRRSSAIAPAETNGAGGVKTPQADLLASKSNYELISSGQHLEMGLHFSTAMATGVMMKRATHRAAEQARRDRMKTAMVDLAEFLLDGEVTFGTGTTCFVVMRGSAEKGKDRGSSLHSEGSGNVAGEKKTVNKARLIEMALEKMRAQEKEIEMLRKAMEDSRLGDRDRMDITE